jgi:hypothetical protein
MHHLLLQLVMGMFGGGSVAPPTVARNVTVTFRVANNAVPTFRPALDVPVTFARD